jgi:hypothetical protein
MTTSAKLPWRWGAGVLVAAAAAAPAPAAAESSSAQTVMVAAVTAALTAGGTYWVKEYFDGRREARELQRQTEDILEEIKRLESLAEALEAENAAWCAKLARAAATRDFWTRLIEEDKEFLKPRPRPDRADLFEAALERLYIRQPGLVEKMNRATAAPAGEWEREVILNAYGAGTAGADFNELITRLELGLRGGVVRVTGERDRRYVSGAENLMALVDYVRAVGGPECAAATFERLWALTPEETAAVAAELPPAAK